MTNPLKNKRSLKKSLKKKLNKNLKKKLNKNQKKKFNPKEEKPRLQQPMSLMLLAN